MNGVPGEVLIAVLIPLTVLVLLGSLYLLLLVMARREDVSEVIHEAILTDAGYVVIERRKFQPLTEEVFKRLGGNHG